MADRQKKVAPSKNVPNAKAGHPAGGPPKRTRDVVPDPGKKPGYGTFEEPASDVVPDPGTKPGYGVNG